jgi:prepilin-type processing-associated H-X9-DG protein
LPALARARESARRSSCANNLKQMGLVYKMYGNESKGNKYPIPHVIQGTNCDKYGDIGFIFQGDAVYPEYLTDINVLICPSAGDAAEDIAKGRWNCNEQPDQPICPCEIDAFTYVYVGWALMNDSLVTPGMNHNDPDPVSVVDGLVVHAIDLINQDLDALTDGDPTQRGAAIAIADKDIKVEGSTKILYRMKEGIERFFITDINNPASSSMAQSSLCLMWDQCSMDVAEYNHIPGGSNVLYLDGHVTFIRYPGDFPVDTVFAWANANL